MRFTRLPLQMFNYTRRYLVNNYIFPSNKLHITHTRHSSTKSPFLFICSIGNPDPDYSKTRHSVGHYVLEQLIKDHWTNFKPFQKHRNISKGVYSVSTNSDLLNVLLFKSNETYMNLQGEPIFNNWKKISKIQQEKYDPKLVIIHDEIKLPLGKIQFRDMGTSARGHNGLKSIDNIVGKNYVKISVGIGQAPNRYVADYVLSNFKRDELETLRFDTMPQVASMLGELARGQT